MRLLKSIEVCWKYSNQMRCLMQQNLDTPKTGFQLYHITAKHLWPLKTELTKMSSTLAITLCIQCMYVVGRIKTQYLLALLFGKMSTKFLFMYFKKWIKSWSRSLKKKGRKRVLILVNLSEMYQPNFR